MVPLTIYQVKLFLWSNAGHPASVPLIDKSPQAVDNQPQWIDPVGQGVQTHKEDRLCRPMTWCCAVALLWMGQVFRSIGPIWPSRMGGWRSSAAASKLGVLKS